MTMSLTKKMTAMECGGDSLVVQSGHVVKQDKIFPSNVSGRIKFHQFSSFNICLTSVGFRSTSSQVLLFVVSNMKCFTTADIRTDLQ